MATIKPFTALQPNPFYADQLVFPGDEQVFFFGIGQKEHPLVPLKDQLETLARKRPETKEGQQQAYQEIKENLNNLLEMDRLWKDDKPGIYIYEIVHRGYRQTGIWALTSIQDYLDGKIKIHELTLADSERRMSNYRKNTGLEGSPVLMTYAPSIAINRIIAEICAKNKKTTIGNKKSLHRIWKIEDEATLNQLIKAFGKIESVYMADGHHRLASTVKLTLEKQGNNYISSLYIAADQLRIKEYYRIVNPKTKINEALLLEKLKSVFTIIPSSHPVKPEQQHTIGMCLNGQWFKLLAIHAIEPDAVLLQENVLAPFFDITDPRTDPGLKCIGGENAMEETIDYIKVNPCAIAFTLRPLTVDQLIEVAEAGKILPPKSTWIDPKVPYGLLLFQHSTDSSIVPKNHYD